MAAVDDNVISSCSSLVCSYLLAEILLENKASGMSYELMTQDTTSDSAVSSWHFFSSLPGLSVVLNFLKF